MGTFLITTAENFFLQKVDDQIWARWRILIWSVESPSESLLKAISDADWPELLPRLIAYAEQRIRRVGWFDGEDHEPSAMSVKQAVNMAIERCLDGSRRWDDDAPPELGAFLCMVIKSIVTDERKKVRRSKLEFDDSAVERASGPLASDVEIEGDCDVGRGRILAAIEECANGDPDAEAFYLAVLDGNTKREEIATALDWNPEQVSKVRIRLQRRVSARFPEALAAIKARRRAS